MPPATTQTKKVVFLDRDGTINQDTGFVHAIKDWQFVPGAIEAMQTLQENGFTLTVVTNQSGIAHELYTEEDMQKVHEYMLSELTKNDINIASIAYCSHGRDSDCRCRKPRTGMIDSINQEIGPIDMSASWTIGDKIADLLLGQNASTKTALIKSKYWQESDLRQLKHQPDLVTSSLLQAARKIK